jgi:hypothetical protein
MWLVHLSIMINDIIVSIVPSSGLGALLPNAGSFDENVKNLSEKDYGTSRILIVMALHGCLLCLITGVY